MDKINNDYKINIEIKNEINKESKIRNAVYFSEKEIPKFTEDSGLNTQKQVFTKLHNEEVLSKINYAIKNKFKNRNEPV